MIAKIVLKKHSHGKVRIYLHIKTVNLLLNLVLALKSTIYYLHDQS